MPSRFLADLALGLTRYASFPIFLRVPGVLRGECLVLSCYTTLPFAYRHKIRTDPISKPHVSRTLGQERLHVVKDVIGFTEATDVFGAPLCELPMRDGKHDRVVCTRKRRLI